MRALPLLLVAGVTLLAACAPVGGGPWTSGYEQEHPLVGHIWDVVAQRFIDEATLRQRLPRGRFVLLGERHDNPDHHRLQARMLEWIIAAGRQPVVAFEMLTVDQEPALQRHLATAPRDAAGLGPAVDWEHSGWPDWSLYQPIAQDALSAGLPIVAVNLGRTGMRALRARGLGGLDPTLVKTLGLDRPLDPATREDLAREIRDSHCGQAPESALDAMIAVQRARDAEMAWRLAEAGRRDGGVLITGAGHVRRDRAVPAFLAAAAPGVSIVSVALLEVERGDREPAAYGVRAARDGQPLYDYVWFTPRVDNVDPCEQFRKSLQKLRQPGKE